MHRLRQAARGLVLLTVALLVAPPAPAQTLQSYKSKFYLIQTDMPRAEVLEFGRHMDRIHAQYQRRFANFRSRRTGPMPLYLFRDRAGYVDFMERARIPATNSGGMFFIQPAVNLEGLATWTSDRSRSEAYEVLQHEGFHQFAYNYFGNELPIWANEGLAQYFEDAVLVGARMELGLVDDRRLAIVKRALAENEAIPLDTLLSISHREWGDTLQTQPARAALLYAQSWTLVYFLVHADHEKYQKAFTTYLNLISDGRASATAFHQAFGVSDAAPVERRWRAYIEKLEPDPVTSAVGKLEFLGQGLLFAREQKAEVKTLAELRDFLQTRQFRLTRSSHGIDTELAASNAELFRYTRKNGSAGEFELLPPAAADLPPRLRAPGLKPEPTLVWSKDGEDELVQDVEYR